jgi:hypothetical protein
MLGGAPYPVGVRRASRKEDEMFALRCVVVALVAGLAFGVPADAADKGVGSVEGKVTLFGKPVAAGKISFHPAKGKPVVARVKDGDYSVNAVPAGEVVVTIEGKGVPPKYASPKTSPLRLEVRKGKNVHDVALSR